jgi:hypothetical protein
MFKAFLARCVLCVCVAFTVKVTNTHTLPLRRHTSLCVCVCAPMCVRNKTFSFFLGLSIDYTHNDFQGRTASGPPIGAIRHVS